VPRQPRVTQLLEHEPGCLPAAERHDGDAAYAHGLVACGLDGRCCASSCGTRVWFDDQVQGVSPLEPGSYHPP
jgi:hypothetical protein